MSPAELLARLETMRSAFAAEPYRDARRRSDALDRLRTVVLARREEIARAVSEDFGGRAREETLALEIFPLADEIRYARRRLRRWMKPRRVRAGWIFLPGRAHVLHQPLGVVGILGAWNYPVLLSLSPLVSALAAGNHAMVKPSEIAPATAAALGTLLSETYPEEYVSVVTGGPDVASAFSALPFDHLIFTGATETGRKVMRAASANLTPVTLELGGKSPALVHPEYPLARAARRILVGKLLNAGQTCLAPDYALVHSAAGERFVEEARRAASALYPRLVDNPDYTRIVHRQAYRRLEELVGDAAARGARVVTIDPAGESFGIENRVFPPTLLFDVREGMRAAEEEIFGPVLPILVYERLEEAIASINRRPRPLAFYYFDEDSGRAAEVLRRTHSGGATVNDVLFHFAQNELPFGGVGPSGMGRYHGRAGFETFSNRKSVFLQSRNPITALVRPPYGWRARSIIRFLIGWR